MTDYLDFPHNAQVFRIERFRTQLKSGKQSHEIIHGVTSLTVAQADAARLLRLNRGHWQIENSIHWVRDVTFDEDRSQVRKGNGPRAMAILRNLAIGLLRLAGASNIAAGLRHLGRKPAKVLRLIGLSSTQVPRANFAGP